jgi:hypothetical protein
MLFWTLYFAIWYLPICNLSKNIKALSMLKRANGVDSLAEFAC